MGPSTNGHDDGRVGRGPGRGNPPPAQHRPMRSPDGAGAPSPGVGKLGTRILDQAPRPRPFLDALIGPPNSTHARQPRPGKPCPQVRLVFEKPTGDPGAGPSWAGDPPGPNHWWCGEGWVRWVQPIGDGPRPADPAEPAPMTAKKTKAWPPLDNRSSGKREGTYEVLLFGPSCLHDMLRDGRLAALLRGIAMRMQGFDVHPVLFALSQASAARWETNHVRFTPRLLMASTRRVFERRFAATAATLRDHLPAAGTSQRPWHAVLIIITHCQHCCHRPRA